MESNRQRQRRRRQAPQKDFRARILLRIPLPQQRLMAPARRDPHVDFKGLRRETIPWITLAWTDATPNDIRSRTVCNDGAPGSLILLMGFANSVKRSTHP